MIVPSAPTPSQSDAMTAMGQFLTAILPAGTPIFQAQDNRVPEPTQLDFVVFQAVMRERLETNEDNYDDCSFTASIAAKVMNVSAVKFGTVTPGRQLFGVGVTDITVIGSQISGTPGGVGTYNVSISQSISSQGMAAGVETMLQPIDLTIQIDIHSASRDNAADMAQTISTIFRDDYGVQIFKDSGFDVYPLHADDPRQLSFLNSEQEYETRWVVDAHLQVNQVVSPSQQFADDLEVNSMDVNSGTYPP